MDEEEVLDPALAPVDPPRSAFRRWSRRLGKFVLAALVGLLRGGIDAPARGLLVW